MSSGRPGHWTPAEIPDLSGRVALVTGASSGLGLETAKVLAANGARVLMTSRDASRGQAALEEVRRAGRSSPAERVPSVELVRLDLADQAQVREAVHDVGARVGHLDLLVANAGVMATPRRVTVDGFEGQMATNHLGHFALVGGLLPRLLAGPAPRVVTVSSLAHRIGRLTVSDPLGEAHRYHAWPVYGRTKLANLLFAMELQRRADAAGADLLSVAAHPGLSSTNLVAAGPMRRVPGLSQLSRAVWGLWSQSAAVGAWPTLFAATRPGLVGGEYVGPAGPGETRGSPVFVAADPTAYDEELGRAVWARSVELTGQGYDAFAAQ